MPDPEINITPLDPELEAMLSNSQARLIAEERAIAEAVVAGLEGETDNYFCEDCQEMYEHACPDHGRHRPYEE